MLDANIVYICLIPPGWTGNDYRANPGKDDFPMSFAYCYRVHKVQDGPNMNMHDKFILYWS